MQIDWKEAEWLNVIGVRKKKYTLWDRLCGKKVIHPSEEEFNRLGRHRCLVQRGTFGGPEKILDRLFLPTARRIRVHPKIRTEIINLFETQKDLTVGVHIRRGDFKQLPNGERYDIHSSRHPQVPLWWYQYAMHEVVQRFSSVRFFLCHNGLEHDEHSLLKRNWDLLEMPRDGLYGRIGDGHFSKTNPVADLFALACCPIIISTPMSTFCHYAANALGSPSLSIVPTPLTSKDSPGYAFCRLYGKRAPTWVKVVREGQDLHEIHSHREIPCPDYDCDVDWL